MIYLLKRIVQPKSPYLNKGYSSIIASIFLVFCINFSLNSQQKQTKIPLIEILTQLEKNNQYKFTYANDIIKGISIELPPNSLTFKEKINYLEKKTGLIFQFLDSNFIAIKASNEIFSICGYVLDKETRFQLEAVAVIGANHQTTTDSFGYFELKVNSMAESITIRSLGFQPVSITGNSLDNNQCTNIYLVSEIETLSEIVLSNIFAKGINKVSNGSLNINFSNFGILPGLIEPDVLQTIQALPGIQSTNETVSDINIRGGSNDQNLILWDGIKMYQSGHFFGLISALNPQITKEASIIKNGTPVDYTEGISGTIAMKTNRAINNSFSASIASNFVNTDIFTDIPTSENSSLQFTARKAISNIGETPTYKNYFNRIQQDTEVQNFTDGNAMFDFYDTSFRWLYDISDKDQIRVNFIYIDNGLSFLESAIIDGVEKSRMSRLEQNSLAGSIFYKRNWNSFFTTILQVTNSEYKLGANNVDILQANRLTQVNKVEETSTKLNTWFTINDKFSLLSGYQFTETAVNNLTDVDDPLFIRLVREVIREHGLYSQLKYNNEKTSIQIGGRYSYIPKINKHIIEPRLSINHKVTDELNIELLGEFKHQNTMQIINFQNDFFGVEKRRWFLSNDTSRPVIRSKQISLGLNYNNNGWLISADVYLKRVDGINAQSQGFLNQYIFSDAIGAYDVYGIEFLLNKKINKLSTWLSYTYAENTYTFNSLPEINFPNNIDIRHSVTFGTSYAIDNFKIAAGINWRTGIPNTEPVDGNEFINNSINYLSANSSNLEDYFRVDASATYKFKLTEKIKAETGISIWNASNNENIISKYYNTDEEKNINTITKNALELTPNFSLRVLF